MMHAPAKVLVGQRSKIDKRIRNPQFAPDERDETEHEQDQQRMHAVERIAEPVPLLSFAEHDFPADHGEAQQTETDCVEGRALLAHLRLLGL